MNEALADADSKITRSWHASSVRPFFLKSLVVTLLVMWGAIVSAQAEPEHAGGAEHQHAMRPKTLSEQIGDLSRQVSELQAKVKDQGVDAAAMKANGDEARVRKSMGMSGSPSQALGMALNFQSGPSVQSPQAGIMAGMMSMMNSMMGGMGGAAANAPMGQAVGMGPSALMSELPGFPGASHLYHIGATNFFLDHPQHISLSLEQQRFLADLRTKALLKRSEFNRKIQELEEQIWLLTASDQPNLASIEGKIRESEKLQGDFRLSFIRDVGEAAKVLTDGQRTALLGQLPQTVQATPMVNNASGPMGGM